MANHAAIALLPWIDTTVSDALVSVVIPTYNAAQYLPAALDSVLDQSYRNVEVVVVDDGSTDTTFSVLEPYRDRIVYHWQPNAGLADARNVGMELARGDLIAWADADDICLRDRLLVQAGYMALHPEVLAVGANFSAFDDLSGEFDHVHAARYYLQVTRFGLAGLFPERETIGDTGLFRDLESLPARTTVYRGDVWRRLVLGNFIHPPTLMLRRQVVEHTGKLRQGIRTAEDWEYITRVARQGPVAFIDAPLIRYRCHSRQMSSASGSQVALSSICVLEWNLAEYTSDLEAIKPDILRTLGEFHADAAYSLADLKTSLALLHLCKAVRLNPSGTRFGWLLARILAPDALLQLVRKQRERFRASRRS